MIVILLLMVLYTFVCLMEAAVMHLNRSKVRADAESGHAGAQLLLKHTDPPDVFMAAMQTALSAVGLGVIGSVLYLAGGIAEDVNFFAAAGAALVLLLIPAAIFAKRFAQLYATKTAYDLIKPMSLLAWLIYPAAAVFSVLVNAILRLAVRIRRKEDGEDYVEEEIRTLADEASEAGAIDIAERTMIHNVFDFSTKTAEDLSVHRTHISAIEIDSSIEEIAPFITEEKFTRIPVYEDNLDNILGLLHTKDILGHVLHNRTLDGFSIRNMLREAYFVPSSKKLDDLFMEMKGKQVHMAIVVDEYGGTVGLVTMEDLVEEIMGSILDEHDEQEAPAISRQDDGTFAIDGTAMLKDVSEFLDEMELGVEFPEDDYDTLGGFLIGQLGRFPEEDETPEIEYGGLHFRITQIQEKLISRVVVTQQVTED